MMHKRLIFSFYLCLRLASPNYAFVRRRLYSEQKVKENHFRYIPFLYNRIMDVLFYCLSEYIDKCQLSSFKLLTWRIYADKVMSVREGTIVLGKPH